IRTGWAHSNSMKSGVLNMFSTVLVRSLVISPSVPPLERRLRAGLRSPNKLFGPETRPRIATPTADWLKTRTMETHLKASREECSWPQNHSAPSQSAVKALQPASPTPTTPKPTAQATKSERRQLISAAIAESL